MWQREATEWVRKHQSRVSPKHLKAEIASWERGVALATPTFTQCHHLIKKFGGIIPFSVATGRHPASIIKYWLSTEITPVKHNRAGVDKTSGLIPTAYLALLVQRARLFGVLLMADDIYPDFVQNEVVKVETDFRRWQKHLHSKHMTQRKLEHRLASASSASIQASTEGSP